MPKLANSPPQLHRRESLRQFAKSLEKRDGLSSKRMSKIFEAGSDDNLGLIMVTTPEKGRGVVSAQIFEKNEPIIEYCGELIDNKTCLQREQEYKNDPTLGSFVYHLRHKDVPLWCVFLFFGNVCYFTTQISL